MRCLSLAAAALVVAQPLSAPVSAQQPPPDYGHNFITIGDAGNPAYDALDPFVRLTGRGVVDQEFRIARTEMTTEQFVPFANAVNALGAPITGGSMIQSWGAVQIPGTNQFEVFPGFEKAPVIGISWHLAALYCNWLHNDQGSDRASFTSGAYDSDTFLDGSVTTDQLTRSPGARFWIPSLDEWLKAAHYDPDKNGPGQGGWWTFSNGSETPLVPGMPGEGETSAGLDINSSDAYLIRLESYPDTQSPSGLLDLSGGGSEWTEEFQGIQPPEQDKRIIQGNGAGDNPWTPDEPFEFFTNLDAAYNFGSERPGVGFSRTTLRIASAVPHPGTATVAVLSSLFLISRRRT